MARSPILALVPEEGAEPETPPRHHSASVMVLIALKPFGERGSTGVAPALYTSGMRGSLGHQASPGTRYWSEP